MGEEEVKNRVYNIGVVCEECKKAPHTYKTILEDCKDNGTYQTIIRRKISKLIKRGELYKMAIPGTRFGKAVFYHDDKKYFILVEGGRSGSNVYYFYDYEKISRFYIKLGAHWKLEKGAWVEQVGEMIMFEGNILKWI